MLSISFIAGNVYPWIIGPIIWPVSRFAMSRPAVFSDMAAKFSVPVKLFIFIIIFLYIGDIIDKLILTDFLINNFLLYSIRETVFSE